MERERERGLGPETRAIIQAMQKQRGQSRDRYTHCKCIQVALIPTELLKSNPQRIYYFIQNIDAANFIAVAPQNNVAVGGNTLSEGTRILAGDYMEDTDDLGPVWGIADTAAVFVIIVEVIENIGGSAHG